MDYKIYKSVLNKEFIEEFLNSVNRKRFHPGKVGVGVNVNQKRRKDLFIQKSDHINKLDNKIYEKIYFDVRSLS